MKLRPLLTERQVAMFEVTKNLVPGFDPQSGHSLSEPVAIAR